MSIPEIGTMQGRLLPPFENRFQGFPAADWREEFPRAAAAGLKTIEWIFEKHHATDNPLGAESGITEMRALMASTGTAVRSICADYFMTETLVTPSGGIDAANLATLRWLIAQARALAITYIVLPFVDASSLKTSIQMAAAIEALRAAAPDAAAAKIELHIECDLTPPAFRDFLRAISHPAVKANYDIGNSASLGYPPGEELPLISPWLGSVHVKDRRLGGGTVPLGQGDADLPGAFREIRRLGFSRWLILQVAREENIDHVTLARRNRETVERLWREAA